jgi:Protein of unknown function (DUF3987)
MSAAYARAALDSECAKLARTTSGRNQQLNASAFSVGQLVGVGEIDRTLAEQRLFDAATANGYVGKDGPAATRASIRSGLSAGERQPRQIPNGSIAAPKPASVAKASTPGLPTRTPEERLHTPSDPDAPMISSGIPGRYHMYRRNGQAVRLKVKKQDGNYVNLYRVRDPNTGSVGWQAKKPEGYVVVPYTGNDDPFASPASADFIFCPEGEKDVDTLVAKRFPAFTFGGASDVPEGCEQFVRARAIVVLVDNDEPGRRWADKISTLFAATAASVRVVHFPELPEHKDVSDWMESGGTVAALLERVAATKELASTNGDDSSTWAKPDLCFLGSGRRPAPSLPADLFRRFWHHWLKTAAAQVSAPEDYVAVSLLASAGSALANVRWPVAGAAWFEPPILWCGLVGSPSTGKSPAIDVVYRLVQYAEDRMAAGFDDLSRDFETRKHIAEASREAWKADVRAAVKAGTSPSAMPTDAIEPTPPTRPRIRVADATTERLGALAAALPRGLLLQRDELSGWLGAFDKYGGGGSDRAFAIEMYGGRSYVVDRVNNPEPLRVRHLSVGVLGGVHPDKLSTIIDGPDDGLSSRILWAWPDMTPLFSPAREIGTDIHAQNAFARLTELRMGSDQFGNPEPIHVRLSAEAEDALEEFGRDMDARSGEASGLFAGSLGKARGHALRLSLVIEYLWWCGSPSTSEPEQISVDAVNAAAALMEGYFIPMAERVYGDAAIPAVERAAMVLARHLRKSGPSKFNARKTRREIGGVLRDASAMNAACATLVEAGLIRPDAKQPAAGRPPLNFEVNTRAFGREP